MSKYAYRMLNLLKFAMEQGMLFNLPPVATKNPETDSGYERRVYQQPIDGYYRCAVCKTPILEDDISSWKESDDVQTISYNPKLDPNYSSKVLGALYECKELVETFIEEFQKLPPIPDDWNKTNHATWGEHWEKKNKIKRLYRNLIHDFNNTLNNIPEQFFDNEEVYNPIKFLYNRTLSAFDIDYNPGRILEDAHEIIQVIDSEIQKVKTQNLETVTYEVVVMEPVCTECYDELKVRCDWCGERGILQGKGYNANFVNISNNDYLCRSCYENSSSCDNCSIILPSEETYYNERTEGTYCERCYDSLQSKPYDIEPVKNVIETVQSTESFFPIDTKQIEKTILPKVLLPLKTKPFSLETIERQATKAKLPPELMNFVLQVAKSEDFQTMEDLISKLYRQVETEKQFKEKYPNIKKLNKIPLDIRVVEEHDRDMPSFTITIRPAKSLIEYAEGLFPGDGKKALETLSSGGHHAGAMAYARIGFDEDEDAFVINNLQTDADLQKLVRHSNGQLPDHLKSIEPAIRWWLKQFENWPAQLLDIVRQFGLKMDKPVYLTNFNMQKRKWSRIPDRSKDLYDKIPAQMGFQPEDVSMNVEALGKDDWEMYRVARIIRMRALRKIGWVL